ncbi:hypothetical protein F4777DRAFT_543542 [Nemania sp. FL0916]|nr:hypothetical protein F4777DRAFT_543542 [Nemania sp. FL0916]
MTSTDNPVLPAENPGPAAEADTGSEEPVALVFHGHSDLKVTIQTSNNDQKVYMVCASSLACASPIWRSMLDCGASDGLDAEDATKQGRIQTMELNGDGDAIALLFYIIHYDFSRVPKAPSLDQLFEICKSANQYKCTRILYPWVNQWISRLANFAAEEDVHHECHKVLYVAWTFGDLKLFREMVDALIISTKIDVNGKVVNTSGQLLEQMLMPLELLDTITDVRASTVAKVLDIIKTPIDDLSRGTRTQPGTYCKVGKSSQECEIMMLGSVIPALIKAGLFPVPGSETYTDSIVNLKDTLDNVKTKPFVGKDWMPHLSHEHCNLGFREAVLKCVKAMEVPLGKSIMSWMSVQAQTCGIEATTELEEWRLGAEASSLDDAENTHHVANQESPVDED